MYRIIINFRTIKNYDNEAEFLADGESFRKSFHFVEMLKKDTEKENVYRRVQTYCDGEIHEWGR